MDNPLVESLYCLHGSDYGEQTPPPVYTDQYQWGRDWALEHQQVEPEPPTYYSHLFSFDNDQSYDLKPPISLAPTPPPDIMDKRIQDISRIPTHEWQHKCVKTWSSFDVMNWLIYELKSRHHNYETASMKSFQLNGDTLCSLTKLEFEQLDPTFGAVLYDALQKYKNMSPPYVPHITLPPIENIRHDVFPEAEPPVSYEMPSKNYGNTCSDGESDSSQMGQEHKPKRKPGRSPTSRGIRRKQEKKTGRLWEFIRDLLKNREYCPSLICWENYDEGVFRFVRSDKVAELWGTIKENPRMTYEKLSRAMRYYYKSKVLLPVLGRRLVYKFGPSATNWQTPNPNFRFPDSA